MFSSPVALIQKCFTKRIENARVSSDDLPIYNILGFLNENIVLDERRLFGLVDRTLDPDEDTNYIHLSKELLENIRQQPGVRRINQKLKHNIDESPNYFQGRIYESISISSSILC